MATYRRSKLGRFFMIGGLLGAAVSLFDRSTREAVTGGMVSLKNNSVKLCQTVKENPSSVSNYIKNTAENIKMTAREISQDVKEMAGKVGDMTQSSKQAYQYAMEAGNEVSQIAQKIRYSGQGLMLNGTQAQSTAMLSSGPSPTSARAGFNTSQGTSAQSNTKTNTGLSGGSTGAKSDSSTSSSFGSLNASKTSSDNNSHANTWTASSPYQVNSFKNNTYSHSSESTNAPATNRQDDQCDWLDEDPSISP